MAITHTVETALDWVESKLNDASNLALTEAEIQEFLLQGIIADETTYTFHKRTTGVFTCDQFGEEISRLLYFQNSTTPFTGEDGLTYLTSCAGTIRVTVGSATATSISVIGAPVDLSIVMPHALMTLATRAGRLEPQTMGGASFDPSQHSSQLRRLAEYWRGGAV